jgi:NADH-quinone oxidoreductase subunit J
MVLFLFIIMMLGLAPQDRPEGPGWQRWLPFVILMAAVLACTLVIIALDPAATAQGEPYSLGPQDFGEALFGKYALAVQVVSFQLLFAAVGAYNLGRIQRGKGKP